MSRSAIIAFPPAPPRFWNPEADDVLVCLAVQDETPNVKTFVLAAPEPRLFHFRPGQFLTVEVPLPGGPVSRCYTVASAPTRPSRVSITVKMAPDGPVSKWLHDMFRPGMRLRVAGPLGDFTCADRPVGRSLYLSAGSGITPLMSMARSHDDLASQEDIVFVHCARSPADVIFRQELALLARRPGFRLALVCGRDAPGERWHGLTGRLSLPMLQLIAPDMAAREVYTCGPAPFMAAVRAMLAEAACDPARYHEESFDFGALTAATPAAATAEQTLDASGYSIAFTKSGRSIRCSADTHILDAARAAGLRLPFSCAKGVCGTCKCRLISGEVDMQHGGGIRQREIAAGQILICCARPRGDLVIDQ